MKKTVLLNCLIVLLLIVFSSLSVVKTAFAQEVASESAKNNYQLPYPGLLPDNPLYTIKTLRDRIIEFLISDPLKKAEFDLLSSDKRLSVGIALFENKKFDLAESTISKGQNYFEEGIRNLETSRKEGRQIDPSLLVNYDLSSKKHKEILESLVVKSKGDVNKRLTKDLERSSKIIDLVSKIKLELAK